MGTQSLQMLTIGNVFWQHAYKMPLLIILTLLFKVLSSGKNIIEEFATKVSLPYSWIVIKSKQISLQAKLKNNAQWKLIKMPV